MTHLKRLASCLLAILLVITLIPGGVLTTAHAAQATLTPDAVVNPADNVTLSKTAVQTAIDEWEVTLQISGGGSTTVKPQIDIVLVTDYSDSMDEPVYGSGGVCGSTSFRADEETKRVCAKCGSDDIEWKGGIFTGRWQCEKCRSTNIVKRKSQRAGGARTATTTTKGKTIPLPVRRNRDPSILAPAGKSPRRHRWHWSILWSAKALMPESALCSSAALASKI